MSSDARKAAGPAPGGEPGEPERGETLRERLHGALCDFVTDVGGERASLRRLRLAAWTRLLFILPLLAVPTALGFVSTLEHAHAPGAAQAILWAWAILFLASMLVNVGILAAVARNRPGLARGLTYATLTGEVVTNQLALQLIGPLSSHGVVYMVIIVGIYRTFFDYRLALYALCLGSATFVAGVIVGHVGALPLAPILPTFEHWVYEDFKTTLMVAYTVIAAALLTFVTSNYAVNQSAKLHRYITESVLRRYLPASLVDRAARGELRLDATPERRKLTVMFTDLVGFTAMSERIGEREVAEVLNRYLSRCADVAHEYGATIDKFIGDGVMIILGAPDELPPADQARRCVSIAKDMRKAIADTPLEIRAGIHTGEAIVGHFGSEVRSDFTAVGHTVNIAARLETTCEPGRILVGEETAALLEPEITVEPAGVFQLKGISHGVRAYYVVEDAPDGAREARTRPRAVEA